MKPNRSKLRVEELERRENPTATNIGFNTPPNNVPPVEFIVAGYTLKQNNGNFATTSSAFGFQDATMTVAQMVTTANGGTVSAVLDDAFDGALSWGLARANGSVAPGAAPANGPLTYFDHDGIVDIVGAPLAPNKYGPGAIITGSPESTSFNGDSFNGLRLWQQNAVFSVNGAPVIRSVFFVGNPTGGTITQNLGVFSNLGSDTNTRIFDTGSGDFLPILRDLWAAWGALTKARNAREPLALGRIGLGLKLGHEQIERMQRLAQIVARRGEKVRLVPVCELKLASLILTDLVFAGKLLLGTG